MYTYVYGSVILKEKDLLLEKQESVGPVSCLPFSRQNKEHLLMFQWESDLITSSLNGSLLPLVCTQSSVKLRLTNDGTMSAF